MVRVDRPPHQHQAAAAQLLHVEHPPHQHQAAVAQLLHVDHLPHQHQAVLMDATMCAQSISHVHNHRTQHCTNSTHSHINLIKIASMAASN